MESVEITRQKEKLARGRALLVMKARESELQEKLLQCDLDKMALGADLEKIRSAIAKHEADDKA